MASKKKTGKGHTGTKSKAKRAKAKEVKGLTAKAKAGTVPAKPERLSAINAAAQVLAKAKEPMNVRAIIEAMQAQGLWESPGGKTPHATLAAALIRDIAAKGKESKFAKVERGLFAATGKEA